MREVIRYPLLSVNVQHRDPNRHTYFFYRTRTFRDVTIQDVIDEYVNSPKEPLSMVYMTTNGYPHIVWHKDVDTDDAFFQDLPADEPITHHTDKEQDVTFLYMKGVQIGYIEKGSSLYNSGKQLRLSTNLTKHNDIVPLGKVKNIDEAKTQLRLAYTHLVAQGRKLRRHMKLLNLSRDETAYAHPDSSTYGSSVELGEVARLLAPMEDFREVINLVRQKVEEEVR